MRLARLADDFWELASGEERHRAAPDQFWIPPGEVLIRLASSAGAGEVRVEGRYLGHSRDTLRLLRLGFATGEQAVPTARIERLWVRRGGRTRTGAVVGVLILAPLFALAAGLACSDTGYDSSDCTADGLVLGATSGAVLGGLVGAALPRWRLVYPSRGPH